MLKKVASIALCCSSFATGDALTQYFDHRRIDVMLYLTICGLFGVRRMQYGLSVVSYLCFVSWLNVQAFRSRFRIYYIIPSDARLGVSVSFMGMACALH